METVIAKPRPSIFLLVFILIFLVMGLLAVYLESKQMKKAYDSENWPTADGKIISSEVASKRAQSSKKIVYYPKISYRYTIEGTDYASNKTSFSEYNSAIIAHAENVVARFPADSSVKVYYNPDDPKESVIETGIAWSNHFAFFIGLLIFMVGAVGLIWYLKNI